jgi:hypothetical protein
MARRAIPAALDRRVREAANQRCGYCLSPQHLVLAPLEIEHIIPLAHGGTDDESNLWLACPLCNAHKAEKTTGVDPDTGATVPLFNPRHQHWADHFAWIDDGLRIAGKTTTGRATVIALRLSDHPIALEVRRYWISVGWHPPTE